MATLDDLLQINRAAYRSDAFGQSVSAGETFSYGLQFADAQSFQAAQLRQGADNAMAVGTHRAEDVGRQEALVQSRALAVAAASGGGASDPGVVALIARNAQEGAYRKAVALYEGEDRSRALKLAADVKDYEGKSGRVSSAINAAGQVYGATTTLLTGQAKDSSLRQRFGMGAPGAVD